MRTEFYLEGLACTNCATKIQQAAEKLDGVSEAIVDFSKSKIIVEAEPGRNGNLKSEIEEIVAAIEPHVVVGEKPQQKEKPEILTGRNIAFGLGLIGFFIALFLPEGTMKISLFIISYLLAGFEIIQQAWFNIRQGQIFDEHFLMSVATLGAIAIGEYPEAAAVMLFYRTGEFLQSLAVDRSRRSISALIAIRPEIAHRKHGDEIQDIAVEDVQIGDLLVVQPGERIPVDGVVVNGFSSLDTSALTGESVPRAAVEGDTVLAGCINLNGLLTIQAAKPASESAVSRILDLVENATANKAPTEDFITSFARYYTPVVVGIALLIAVIPPIVSSQALFSDWLYRALVFLVISCPCALVVSIPLGFFGGIGGASRQGVLVKGSNYLQALHEVDTVVFDKTGTLTSGSFVVHEIKSVDPFTEETILELAAHAESVSNHPIARSVMDAYEGVIDKGAIETFQELTGLGIEAHIRGHHILAGNTRLLEKHGIHVRDEAQGTGVYVAIDNQYAGLITIVDHPKADAAQTIQGLKELGIKNIIMLTGDTEQTAKTIGDQLGIDDVRAELLPHDKVTELETIMAAHHTKGKVAFVGDGINDAPALARADVGIAMGALGSDAAIETADVVLMTDEPGRVVDAVVIARRTNRIVWQNIALALGVKLAVLVLGALGMATLWEAVFADVGVTILAVLNSVRTITPQTKTSIRSL